MPKTNHQRNFRDNNQASIQKTKRWKRIEFHDVTLGHRGIAYAIKGRKKGYNREMRRLGKRETVIELEQTFQEFVGWEELMDLEERSLREDNSLECSLFGFGI